MREYALSSRGRLRLNASSRIVHLLEKGEKIGRPSMTYVMEAGKASMLAAHYNNGSPSPLELLLSVSMWESYKLEEIRLPLDEG